jgi:hypothetical protein
MADEHLRALEREAGASGDPKLLGQLIAEQLRAERGRFFASRWFTGCVRFED